MSNYYNCTINNYFNQGPKGNKSTKTKKPTKARTPPRRQRKVYYFPHHRGHYIAKIKFIGKRHPCRCRWVRRSKWGNYFYFFPAMGKFAELFFHKDRQCTHVHRSKKMFLKCGFCHKNANGEICTCDFTIQNKRFEDYESEFRKHVHEVHGISLP